MKDRIKFILFAWIILLFSCNTGTDQVKDKKEPISSIAKSIPTPDFNADTAYRFVKQQVDFGPRVPGTKAHAQCADFLTKILESFKFEVTIQRGTVTTYDNKKFGLKNIIASFEPGLSNRILLCSHWDTRPVADRDSKDRDKPIDGANDGASGVGVLLEIARQLSVSKPNIGIDIIFFDLEDYGQPANSTLPQQENTYCYGSQYWGNNPHKANYYAKYGILLDMVGAKDATFLMEGNSEYYASSVLNEVWNTAEKLGYSDYFLHAKVSPITDDHYYINALTAIPTIDIVHMDPVTKDFGPFHHRHSDNMSIIDKNTLKAVGQTLLEVIYSEK